MYSPYFLRKNFKIKGKGGGRNLNGEKWYEGITKYLKLHRISQSINQFDTAFTHNHRQSQKITNKTLHIILLKTVIERGAF